MSPTIRKAVLPVAGSGTRFLPATKAMAKEMLPVVDKPLIQYAVEEAIDAGIEQIIFVTGSNKRAIEDHFDHQDGLEGQLRAKGKDELVRLYREAAEMAEGIYVRQKKPLGLGHAVWCARHVVADEPFAVLLPDDLVVGEPGATRQMVAAYGETGASQVAVEPVPRHQVGSYGVVDPLAECAGSFPIRGLTEKPAPDVAPSNHAVIGRYVLSPGVFTFLDRHQPGAGGEIQLTDAIQALLNEAGEAVHGYCYRGQRFDCGNKLGYLQAQVALGAAHPDFGEAFQDFLAQWAAGAPDSRSVSGP